MLTPLATSPDMAATWAVFNTTEFTGLLNDILLEFEFEFEFEFELKFGLRMS